MNHYLVVTDRSGRLLAGLGLHEEGRLSSLVIGHLPARLRAANALLHVVPRDGWMRNLIADKAWFAPGHLDAARYLWQVTRWEWRSDGGTSRDGLSHSVFQRLPQVCKVPARASKRGAEFPHLVNFTKRKLQSVEHIWADQACRRSLRSDLVVKLRYSWRLLIACTPCLYRCVRGDRVRFAGRLVQRGQCQRSAHRQHR